VNAQDLTIAPLSPERWPEYRALRLEALQAEPQAYGSNYADNLARRDDYWRGRLESADQSETAWLLFARTGEELVGMVGAEIREANVAVIISLYVRPSHRGQGVSRRLMEEIIRVVSTVQPSAFELLVNPIQTAALSLYRSLGFVIQEEFVAIMGDGKEHSEYRMTLTP
jgi:ribosomal protein S18 acetylase RimI-like enzyme